MIVTLAHFGQANTLNKLHGIRFAGQKVILSLNHNKKLQFRILQSSQSIPDTVQPETTASAIQTISAVLQSRYNPQGHLLNLEALDQEPMLLSAGIESLSNPRSKIGPVICKLIADNYPQVRLHLVYSFKGYKHLICQQQYE